MKKLSLLILAFAAGSASLYGQMMIGTEFMISGDATATFGYDIDAEKFGFKNESNSNIKLEFVSKQSADNAEMVGMGGWVGSIELNDFKIVIDPDHDDAALHLTASEIKFIRDVAAGGAQALRDLTKDDPEAAAAAQDILAILADTKIVGEGRTTNYDASDNLTTEAQAEIDKLFDTIVDELDGAFTQHNHGLLVTSPSIVAKLKNGPLWLQIFDAPRNEAGLVDAIENDEDSDYVAESDDTANDVHTNLSGQGVTLGYTTNDLDVWFGVTSDEAYDSAKEYGFAVSGGVGVNVGSADLKLQVVQGLQSEGAGSEETGVAGKLTTTFGSVKLSGAADYRITGQEDKVDTREDEAQQYEVGLGADVMLTANTEFGADYLYSSKQNVASDVEVVVSDKGGLVDRLSMGLTWGLFDLANGKEGGPATENAVSDMLVKGNLGYDLDAMGGSLTPSVEVTINQIDDMESEVALTLKAVLKDAVPATEFGLKWVTDRLVDANDKEREAGTITAWAKISYS